MTQKEEANISFFTVEGRLLDSFLQEAEDATGQNHKDLESQVARLQKKATYKADGISHLVNAFVGNIAPRPLLSILRIARKRYRCFAIVESPYFDLEDWDGYAAFYARSFTPFQRLSSRVHLFEGNESEAPTLIERLNTGIIQKDHPKWLTELDLRYRGFFVLRPYRSCVIGRTVIEFDKRSPRQISGVEKHRLEDSGQPYCTGAITNTFHLSSLVMTLDTAPAVQQNPVVGVCATASVWVASQVLSGRFGLHKYPYNTITRQALQREHEALSPDSSDWKLGAGLTLHEIKQAFARTGCIPFICGPSTSPHSSSQARMRFLAYTFVESGLPIVAAYSGKQGGHAVTIIGHLLPNQEADMDEIEAELVFGNRVFEKKRHLLLGQAIQLYYAHNDAYGPFDRFRLLSNKEAASMRKQAPVASAARKAGGCLIASLRRDAQTGERKEEISLLQGFVVPLPPYVQNNRPEYVLLDAITKFDKQFPPQDLDLPEAERTKLLWRCFLASAPDFKQSVVRRGYSKEMSRSYMKMHLPLFIWVVELTILRPGDRLSYAAPRLIDGEFLYDSTTPFYEPQCLSFRVSNFLRDFRCDDSLNVCGKVCDIKCFIPVKTRN